MTDELAISSALAHLTRLQILDTLKIKAYGFNELRNELELNPNTLSFHLRTLENAGLVKEAEAGYVLTVFGKSAFEDLIRRAEERLESSNRIETDSNRVLSRNTGNLLDFETDYIGPESPRITGRLEKETYSEQGNQTDSFLNGYR